ncbi:MAG: flagellar hook-associated protein FlgL [Nitrospinales bacterium]
MVFRVTNQAQQQATLNNVFRLSEDIFNTTNALASGKRIARPSDDPSGTRETLSLRTSLRKTEQFIRNINGIKNFTGRADLALGSVSNALTRAKELAVNQLGGLATAETRGFAASEIESLISEVLQAGNTRVGNRFAFGGSKAVVEPFQRSASGAVYLGNTENISVEIARSLNLKINIPGSDVLATDLNPGIDTSTLLSDLNRGAGVTAGAFTLADQAGNTGTVNITASMTVGNAIAAINAAGTNITASVNSAQNGIKLTDSSALIVQALTVSEVSGGSTAADLGILGQRNGSLEGLDLDPRLNGSTRISQLNGGQGLTLSSINIVNGSASGAISLASANTVGDVLGLINNAGLNVTAGISSQGNVLRVVSNNSATTAIVREVGTGTTAEALGLGGGRNILTSLIQLKEALGKNDSTALAAVLENLDTGLRSLGAARASFGAVARRVEDSNAALDRETVNQTEQLSNIEDIDFAQKASELASLQVAFQATLNSTARILQPSILDFLA